MQTSAVFMLFNCIRSKGTEVAKYFYGPTLTMERDCDNFSLPGVSDTSAFYFCFVNNTERKLCHAGVQAITPQLQRFSTAAAVTGTFVGCQIRKRQENVEPICQVLSTTGA